MGQKRCPVIALLRGWKILNQYLKELIYLIFMIGIHKSLQIAPAVKLLISLCLGTVADLLVFGL